MRSRARSNTRTRSTVPIIWGIISRVIIAKTLCLLFVRELAEIGDGIPLLVSAGRDLRSPVWGPRWQRVGLSRDTIGLQAGGKVEARNQCQ